MYFVCLSVCLSVCLLPVFKTTVGSVVGRLRVYVFIAADQDESLFLSPLIAFAPFLSCRSLEDRMLLTHWTSLPLSLWRIGL